LYVLSYTDESFFLLVVQASTDKSIGISKSCCRVCWDFIGILAGLEGVKVYVLGCHDNIYGVELPAWVPVEVVEKMVTQFRTHLHGALLVLMSTPKSQENTRHRRTISTETTSVWSIASGETTEHHPSLDSPVEEYDSVPNISEVFAISGR
jgi:hypothetical protein